MDEEGPVPSPEGIGDPSPGGVQAAGCDSVRANFSFEQVVSGLEVCSSGVQQIMELLAQVRDESAEREQKLLREVQFLTKRVKELEGEVSEFKTAIACSSSSSTKTASTRAKHARSATAVRTPTVSRGNRTNAARDRETSQHDDGRPKVFVMRSGPASDRGKPDLDRPESDTDELHMDTTQSSKTDPRRHDVPDNAAASVRPFSEANDADAGDVRLFSEADDTDDDSWNYVCSTKPTGPKSDVFVGNLKPDITEDSLKKYLDIRAARIGLRLVVHRCRLFPKESSTSARVTVNQAATGTLLTKEFWHRPLYGRKWDYDQYIKPDNPNANASCSDKQDSENNEYSDASNEHLSEVAMSLTPSTASRKRDRSSPTNDEPKEKQKKSEKTASS